MSIYKHKKIAVIGLSVEGIDTVKFLASKGADITCCDRRTPEALGDIYDTLREYTDKFILGNSYLSQLHPFEYIVRSPGVSLFTAEIQSAIARGQRITSQTKIFFQECKAQIVGVTGTKGKGTTSTLIYEMIRAAGKSAWLGGNVGTPLLSKTSEILPSDLVVLELSSFQLEDLTHSPHVAVVLRITQDHLANFDPNATSFHISRDAYVAAKKSIITYQSAEDVVIYSADDMTSTNFADDSKAQKRGFSRENKPVDAFIQKNTLYLKEHGQIQEVCALDSIRLKGIHNLENIAAATLAARAVGVSLPDIQSVARGFNGLEHRLETVRIVDGVTYINDSFSTIPETTIAAIQSFSEPKLMILGGSEKGSDFTELGKEISRASMRGIILIGEMSAKLEIAIKKAGYVGEIKSDLQSMYEIVQYAKNQGKPGDVVLLSPACASFGMFKNYKVRGQEFKNEVSKL